MNEGADYIKRVMEDLDALLADLQSTTAHISYNNQGPPPSRPTNQPSPGAQSPGYQAASQPPPQSPQQQQQQNQFQQQQQNHYQQQQQQSPLPNNSTIAGRPPVSYHYASSSVATNPPPASSSISNHGYQASYVTHTDGRVNNTPPPLPPPPSDLPDTIPPPQQFGDQDEILDDFPPPPPPEDFEDDDIDTVDAITNVDEDFDDAAAANDVVVEQNDNYHLKNEDDDDSDDEIVTLEPLYEPQNIVRRDAPNRVSGSSRSSAGSGDGQYYARDIPTSVNPPASGYSSGYSVGYKRDSRGSSGSRSSREFVAPSNQGNPPPVSSVPPGSQPGSQPGAGMSMISNNLTELDQLLSDLNSAQFMAEVDKKEGTQPGKQPPPPVAPKPSRGGTNVSNVDSLLDQLESSVPSPASSHTEYSHQSSQGYQSARETSLPPSQSGSVATQELDDLMASLSDFKMKDNKPVPGVQQAQVAPMRRSPSPSSEPSYAKPQKSRNLSQSSSATSSMQSSTMTAPSSGGQLESMMSDLQSDLSSKGVNTKTKGLCAACNQPVVGQVITALGKIWHMEHFNCAQCHETLGTRNFYERDGQAYCENDYHSLFAPRCSYCNGPIVDKCVTALNATWHPEHFFCAQCGRPFGDDGFHEKDGKAYCRADFFEMFAPKCGGCGRAIVNNYISGLNRHWHPECFTCWDCHQPFGAGSFFDYEGLPYCETHYHQKRGSLCAGCQKPITGRCITAMYKKFHPEHFVCAFCLKQLNKGTFKEHNDRPYCHPCFVKLFG